LVLVVLAQHLVQLEGQMVVILFFLLLPLLAAVVLGQQEAHQPQL
jgi:hypothetical protein